MDRFQLVNLFEVNGINDYQLRNSDDLFKVFGVKIEEIEGYKTLNEEHQKVFSEFILNFYNAQGIDSKTAIEIKSIYLVAELETWVQDQNEDYRNFYKSKTVALNKDLKTIKILRESKDEEFEDKGLTEIELEPKTYLRFDYKWQYPDEVKNEWLHVLNEVEWY